MRVLVDTSVLIAEEAGRHTGPVPDGAAISVVTVAELHLGVLLARDTSTRAKRLRTLARVERTFEALPIDANVARVFASIVSEARSKGRRPNTMDAWIAATAVSHGAVVMTYDDDFVGLPRVQLRKL
ncbi:MAG TPA: PIN domain-containing protein [Candidatus Dormibacteraeota bacterium]